MKCLEIENTVFHTKYITFLYLNWPSAKYCSGVLVQRENKPELLENQTCQTGVWQVNAPEVCLQARGFIWSFDKCFQEVLLAKLL